MEQHGEAVTNPAACNGIAQKQGHHQNIHSSSHSEQHTVTEQPGKLWSGNPQHADFASGAQIQPGLAFPGSEELLSSPEIATQMMSSQQLGMMMQNTRYPAGTIRLMAIISAVAERCRNGPASSQVPV